MDLIMFKVTVKELFFAEGIIIVKFWIYENHVWTAEWRIKWRIIVTVIYATFAVAKRNPDQRISIKGCFTLWLKFYFQFGEVLFKLWKVGKI